MIEQVIKEMKTTPFTLILLVLGYFGGLILWNDRANYAQAQDVTALKVQLQDVKYTLERSHLDTRLSNVQTELFQLSQKVKDDEAHGKAVDALYYSRIHDLEVQAEAIKTAIANLDRTH